MGFWAKSIRIFTYLCDHGTQSVRRVACQTGVSKSSVHRLTQAMQRRDQHPESWLWETAEGRQWLTRLVVATLYTFGRKRGVGLDTISEFFVRLHLATQVGCSASALRGVMQALERHAYAGTRGPQGRSSQRRGRRGWDRGDPWDDRSLHAFFSTPRTRSRPPWTPVWWASTVASGRQLHCEWREPCWRGSASTRRLRGCSSAQVIFRRSS